jgi:murein DD-endopeptidase MepM/ murein hydrolase activator NlpD
MAEARTMPVFWGRTASGAFALALLCSGVAMAALPRPTEARTPEQLQWQALSLAPLSSGGATGLRMTATDAVEPIEAAPERATVDLTMTLGAGESVRALLTRAGASYGDAGTAGAMIAAAAPQIAPGTSVAVTLGGKTGASRPIARVRLHAGLGLTFDVMRGSGGLALRRQTVAVDRTPLRVRGRVGDGLYWSLRAAGVSPQSATEYLKALATEIDVGSDVAPDDRFDVIIASRAAGGERQLGPLLYAGIDRGAERDLQLVRWASNGRLEWVDASIVGQPSTTASAGMVWPAAGHITSPFGWRYHPILHFARLHKGIDIGASWGSPIVAAADGQVSAAGWAGGYGRQVRIAHGGGLVTSYSHMSQIVAQPGGFVRRGQLIGYVGSSGLSTGPHLHYEVLRSGTPVNPLGVTFAGSVIADNHQADAIKARLRALLSVGVRG